MRRSTIALAGLLCFVAGLAASVQPPAPTPDIRTFRPSSNGFAFVNHFEGSPSPINLGGLDHALGAPTTFGLCGGMSFAACDLFLAGRTPPARTTQPSRGDPLYRYIQKRQTESLGPRLELAGRFGRWMSAPDDGLIGTRWISMLELEEITSSLGQGRPVILGLVFNRHASNKQAQGPAGTPWHNHQVLAYDAGAVEGRPSTTDLRIYDPNYPGTDDAVIRCTTVITGWTTVGPWGGFQAPVLGVACERRVPGHRSTLVRGLFAMPYTTEAPPERLE